MRSREPLPPRPVDLEGVKRLLLNLNEPKPPCTVIEATPGESFAYDHLPGAIHLGGFSELQDWIVRERPDRGRVILCYAETAPGTLAQQFAHFMNALGFEDVRYFADGKDAWREAGLPMESLYPSWSPGAIADIVPRTL